MAKATYKAYKEAVKSRKKIENGEVNEIEDVDDAAEDIIDTIMVLSYNCIRPIFTVRVNGWYFNNN